MPLLPPQTDPAERARAEVARFSADTRRSVSLLATLHDYSDPEPQARQIIIGALAYIIAQMYFTFSRILHKPLEYFLPNLNGYPRHIADAVANKLGRLAAYHSSPNPGETLLFTTNSGNYVKLTFYPGLSVLCVWDRKPTTEDFEQYQLWFRARLAQEQNSDQVYDNAQDAIEAVRKGIIGAASRN